MRVWADAKFNNLVICEREMHLFRRVEHTAFVLNFVLVFVPNLSIKQQINCTGLHQRRRTVTRLIIFLKPDQSPIKTIFYYFGSSIRR